MIGLTLQTIPNTFIQREDKMRVFDRYKVNLRVQDDVSIWSTRVQDEFVKGTKIYSYNTHVADIDHKNKTVRPNGYYSKTTSKHINYVAKEYGYKVVK